ncbi:hypothetical protein GUITHDRAFT_93844 [Guillardia theta CCMP2712]|uniref:CAP-Gly domain-containing protein n=2 Tax=Guillardia theta TaxID=55529 RepID=L1JH70_GUITC|nr:hypothetical protein GUITHDRAFT_93844 [Guillardia theta CCMP2712]EKX47858.1 hypothetical protein GUITHDRAFT_93844 [Guillardia theta CCMP2712]|eukprot:XP_005834838.1 hypothetical protein GUITHDRAFT_93844 [Guillardia theta CCMP2712]
MSVQPPRRQLSREEQTIRDYCMGEDGRRKAESTVLLHVSHSNLKKTFFQEIRLDLHMRIGTVKQKLEFHCGTSAISNRLFLYDERGQVMSECEDDKMLGYYSPYDGCRLHIVDDDPNSLSAGGWLEDVSLVTKYEISEEAYNARKNTYRKFKEEKLKEDPEWSLKKEIDARKAKAGMEPSSDSKSKIEDDEYMATEASAIKVGDRCEVAGGRRGCVKYVGKIPELPKGWWVGVQYDEPVGKNDGSVKGVSYFECLDKYGGFVRPDLVQVGDFPELDPFADLEDEI